MQDTLARLQDLPLYRGQIVHMERLAARSPRFGELQRPLPAQLRHALTLRGIERLYSHQVQAIDASREGSHVIVCTPTSSGKSLIFLLPTLEDVLENRHSVSLFLYPTKVSYGLVWISSCCDALGRLWLRTS